MFESFFEKLGRKSAQGEPWRIEAMPLPIQAKRRLRYKTAGKLARIVVYVRDLTLVPGWTSGGVGESTGESYVDDCANKLFFPALNAWRKEEVRYFQPLDYYYNLSTHVRRLVKDAERDGKGPRDIAKKKACWYACGAVDFVHRAVLAIIRDQDPSEWVEAAINAAANTAYHAALRDGREADLDELRKELTARFAI